MKISHRELCIKAAKHLRNHGIASFRRCSYVACELELAGESPDAFGWTGGVTQLIEVKVSRSDFLKDKHKPWREVPQNGLGMYRSYLCPEGMINESDLPESWGLLWVNDKGAIQPVVRPQKQQSNHPAELNLITSILRREGVKPRIFSYKKYKEE